jgi:hypothetical protein
MIRRAIADLKKEEFKLTEDGVAQEIAFRVDSGVMLLESCEPINASNTGRV